MVKCLPDLSIFTVFLKNRNFIFKIRRSKVTDYAALKERIRSPWKRILSFKRSSHYEKGRNLRESLFDSVVSRCCALLFQRSGYAIEKACYSVLVMFDTQVILCMDISFLYGMFKLGYYQALFCYNLLEVHFRHVTFCFDSGMLLRGITVCLAPAIHVF